MNLRPPSQTWRTFLENHADEIIWVDFFTVPAISRQVLYVLLIICNASRRVVNFNVTAGPMAEWAARQLVEAFTWDTAPTYLLRDRDLIYGPAFCAQVDALGIEDVLTVPQSPWQNT